MVFHSTFYSVSNRKWLYVVWLSAAQPFCIIDESIDIWFIFIGKYALLHHSITHCCYRFSFALWVFELIQFVASIFFFFELKRERSITRRLICVRQIYLSHHQADVIQIQCMYVLGFSLLFVVKQAQVLES